MSSTTIQWTDKTWNPVRGCSLVSPGCTNCYAMHVAHRFSAEGLSYAGLTKVTSHGPVWSGFARTVPEKLQDPFHWTKGKLVFVNSMSDLFHEDVPFEFIADVFAVMGVTTRHTYQILTKRPQRMLEFFAWLAEEPHPVFGMPGPRVNHLRVWPQWKSINTKPLGVGYDNCGPAWPFENVWLGVSVEDQQRADERIPLLLQTPAAIRFLSCEPLLEPVDLAMHLGVAQNHDDLRGLLHWVIVGGESGTNARPFNGDWARGILAQCRAARVPFFMKQTGSDHALLYERAQKDRAGGDPSEWPEDLRVREFPA